MNQQTTVRVGMQVAEKIIDGTIDCGIGLENVQCVQLEEWCKANDRPATDVRLNRIDVLAKLGCCCFCSIRKPADSSKSLNRVRIDRESNGILSALNFIS